MTFRRVSTEDRVSDHAEEITEEIDEAGLSAIAFD